MGFSSIVFLQNSYPIQIIIMAKTLYSIRGLAINTTIKFFDTTIASSLFSLITFVLIEKPLSRIRLINN